MMKIGFVGLGGMGSAMAANLLAAQYSLSVWNRSAEALSPLLGLGAQRAAHPGDLTDVDVLISMLADDRATQQVVVDSGLLAQLKPGAIHLNMATVSVALTKQLAQQHAEHQLHYLAAPVLGRTDVAAAGQLNILLAGDAAACATIQPLLDVMGKQTWYFGAQPEQAAIVKIAANFTIASAIETMAESAALVNSYGISSHDFLQMLTQTLFNAPAYKNYAALISEQRYSPAGFKLSLGLKDVNLALSAAGEQHVPMPFASILHDNFLDALAHGAGDLDWAALATVAARRAGQKTS